MQKCCDNLAVPFRRCHVPNGCVCVCARAILHKYIDVDVDL